jgi:malate dehydrogenase (oxaloacetate-decarboxylating)|tara:strand:+ start:125 stop:367 length:243 start_codon:yes stop_codon:yes gene_type:complete
MCTLRSLKNGGSIWDLNISTVGTDHANQIVDDLKKIPRVILIQFSDWTFRLDDWGKFEIKNRVPITNVDDLSMAYTPGVG